MAMGMGGGSGVSSALSLLEAMSDPQAFKEKLEQLQKVSDQAEVDKESAAQSILDAKTQVETLLGNARKEAQEILQRANDDAQGILATAEVKAKETIGKANEMYADYQSLHDQVFVKTQELNKKESELNAQSQSLSALQAHLDEEKAEIDKKKAIIASL